MALDDFAERDVELELDRRDAAELERGVAETRAAQAAGPPGSAARDAAYAELEARWRREGFDG